MSLKFTTIPTKNLAESITSSATSFKLNSVTGWDGNALTSADFGTEGYGVFRNAARTELELFKFDPTTIADDSITITLRGLKLDAADLTTEVSANKQSWTRGDTFVDLGTDTPQMFQWLKEYIDAASIAGAVDASSTAKGIVEIATQAEIDADTGTGGTGAPISVTPDQLVLSKYGTRLPDTVAKVFLNAVTGMVIDYAGNSAPTGFLLCDGTAYNNDDYVSLALVLDGRFGLATATTFTAAVDNVITATIHGLSDGDLIFVNSTTTLPAGLSANTAYYVISSTTNTFKVSTTSGGSEVDITDTGTGTHSFYTQFNVPDLRGATAIGSGTRTETFTFLDADVNTSTDVITVDSNDWIQTGTALVLSNSGGALPTGLSATTYYAIRTAATTIKLATTAANANAGTAVDITAASGGGTHTLTLTLTARTMADEGGEETHALSDAEMPSHSHDLPFGSSSAGTIINAFGADNSGGTLTDEVSVEGADTKHNNMPPYVVMTKIIKT